MSPIAKHKLCFIDGTLPMPSEIDPMFRAWIWCNAVVLSWLLNASSKEITSSVIYIDSAKEMWNDLKERFAPKQLVLYFPNQESYCLLDPRNVLCKFLFHSTKKFLRRDGSFSLHAFMFMWCYEKDYWLSIRGLCSVVFDGTQWVLCLFTELHLTFWCISSDKQRFSLILQEEKQREIVSNSLPSNEAVVMFTNCDSMKASASPKNSKKSATNKKSPYCTHCGLLGYRVN